MKRKNPVFSQRMTKLAERLESIPYDRFELSHWSQTGVTAEEEFEGCACGWACTIPEFGEAGLGMFGDTLCYRFGMTTLLSWAAVRAFFGVTELECEVLFTAKGYPPGRVTPTDVANRIRSLLKGQW